MVSTSLKGIVDDDIVNWDDLASKVIEVHMQEWKVQLITARRHKLHAQLHEKQDAVTTRKLKEAAVTARCESDSQPGSFASSKRLQPEAADGLAEKRPCPCLSEATQNTADDKLCMDAWIAGNWANEAAHHL
ncbi:hypothetical protein EC973_006991, partial [Apophysomyces ossiformis]